MAVNLLPQGRIIADSARPGWFSLVLASIASPAAGPATIHSAFDRATGPATTTPTTSESTPPKSTETGTVVIDGSSTVYPISREAMP